MSEETRRAGAAFALRDAGGAVTTQGQAEAVIGDDGVSVGPVTVAFLEADSLSAADYRIAIDCWPEGRLELSELGRRFDTFVAELRRARNAARVAGLLAHGVEAPVRFAGALVGADPPAPAELQVYATHVTLVPAAGDPWQIPLGALTTAAPNEEPPGVALEADGRRTIVGQLGRQRDASLRAIMERRAAQDRVLADLTAQSGFSDGTALPREAVKAFDALLERCAAAERLPCARELLGLAQGGGPRLGFAQLLDPDADGLASVEPLPEHWAAFLLVPRGQLVALELLAGPSAATYVFAGGIEAVNADLRALHFRRAPLALTAEQAVPAPGNPHRLALRRLEPLQRLRGATRARIVHNDGWADAVHRCLTMPSGAP